MKCHFCKYGYEVPAHTPVVFCKHYQDIIWVKKCCPYYERHFNILTRLIRWIGMKLDYLID